MAAKKANDTINRDLSAYIQNQDANGFINRMMQPDCMAIVRGVIKKHCATKDENQVDDIFQDVSVKILQAAQKGKITGPEPLKLIFRQERNSAIDHLRKRKKDITNAGTEEFDSIAHIRDHRPHYPEPTGEAAALPNALNKLPAAQKLIFDLCVQHRKKILGSPDLLENASINYDALIGYMNERTGAKADLGHVRGQLKLALRSIRKSLMQWQKLEEIEGINPDYDDEHYISSELHIITGVTIGEYPPNAILEPKEEALGRDEDFPLPPYEDIMAIQRRRPAFEKKLSELLGKPFRFGPSPGREK